MSAVTGDDTIIEMWASFRGNPVGNGSPITTVESAEIVRTELGGFSPSNFVIPGGNRQAVETLRSFTYITVNQIGVGEIFNGYIISPRRTITENDDHTINLPVWPVTEELKWIHTRRFSATTWLSSIYTRLRDQFFPVQGLGADWQFNFIGPPDSIAAVTLDNPSVLNATIEIAKDNNHYIRQGLDALGQPTRILQIGQFSAPPIHWLSSANGADASISRENGLVRLVASIDESPSDANRMVNLCVPYGGGNDITTLVTLERCWRIVNDPSYVNYGRYGTDAESLVRTGKTSIFTTYDPINYPISDPTITATGHIKMINQSGVIAEVNESVVGLRYADYILAGWRLYQGALNTRGFSTDGLADYVMYDYKSVFGVKSDPITYPGWWIHEDSFIDSGLTYPDNTPAVQEITSMALYNSTIAMFKHNAHPHHSIVAVTDSIAYPTQAGDLISVDMQRVGADDDGAFAEMNAQIDMKVMKVVTSYPAMRDTYSLSNVGRFEEDDASDDAQQAGQIQSLQMKQGSSTIIYPMTMLQNVDAYNPMLMWCLMPYNLVRWFEFRVRVDFVKFTGTSTTADSMLQTYVINTPGQDILLDTGDQTVDIQGGTHDGSGYVSSDQLIPGFPLHFHQIPIYGGAQGANAYNPTQNTDGGNNTSKWTFVFSASNVFRLTANNSGSGILETNANMTKGDGSGGADLSKMTHTGVTPLNKNIKPKFSTIARIAAQTLIANLPPHKHSVDKKIPTDGPLPFACAMYVNGLLLPSKQIIASNNRQLDGSFRASFEVQDIGEYMNLPGAAIPLIFYSLADASANPTGAGAFQVTVLGVGEAGGLTTTTKFN